ncbi:Hypothetical protein SSCIU_02387 [Mammaliicoccus sciuri]|nr:Hypothetical protein SSCIU_02387 [Mammaliicoccus sciuri]
MGDGDQ